MEGNLQLKALAAVLRAREIRLSIRIEDPNEVCLVATTMNPNPGGRCATDTCVIGDRSVLFPFLVEL